MSAILMQTRYRPRADEGLRTVGTAGVASSRAGCHTNDRHVSHFTLLSVGYSVNIDSGTRFLHALIWTGLQQAAFRRPAFSPPACLQPAWRHLERRCKRYTIAAAPNSPYAIANMTDA